jgi:drug/metabolite transporter (DMT)-like permease
MDYSKIPYYILFLFLFTITNAISVWGQFVTLPYKNLTLWESYKMALPFTWINWIIITFAINISTQYNLVSPTQTTILLIVLQFIFTLLVNTFYLKQKIYRSDIIAFFVILFGLLVNFFKLTSKFLHIPIPKEEKEEDKDKTDNLEVTDYEATVNKNIKI